MHSSNSLTRLSQRLLRSFVGHRKAPRVVRLYRAVPKFQQARAETWSEKCHTARDIIARGKRSRTDLYGKRPHASWDQRVVHCLLATRMKLLIIDIDDTLFDWLRMWSESFGEFAARLTAKSALSRDELVATLRRLHITARTSERGFARADAEVLGVMPDLIESLAHRFEEDTRSRTRLFPAVLETLRELRERGILVVAHTDTPATIAADRFVELGLDGVVDALFATSGTEVTVHRRTMRRPERARVTELIHPKPDPRALHEILAACGASAAESVYVGDSKMKDIPMARAVGVKDVFAAYGCRRDSSSYDLLRSVSHWTDDDIARERALLAAEPTHSLERFSDILGLA